MLQSKEVYPPWRARDTESKPKHGCNVTLLLRSPRPQTSAATIHNPRITIHATTSASLTTFNILFKNKDDPFRTGAVDRPTG